MYVCGVCVCVCVCVRWDAWCGHLCFVDGVVPQHGVSGLERAGTAAHHTRRCHGTALDVSDSVRSERETRGRGMPLNSLRKVNGENEIRSAMTQRLA